MAPGSWTHFYKGAWTEPGLGGRASDLLPNSSGLDIVWNTYLNKYVLITSKHYSGNAIDGAYMATATDLSLQNWSNFHLLSATADHYQDITTADGTTTGTVGQTMRWYNFQGTNQGSGSYQYRTVTFGAGSQAANGMAQQHYPRLSVSDSNPYWDWNATPRPANFSSGSLGGWKTYNGNWSDSGGVFSVDSGPGNRATFEASWFDDFTYDADVRISDTTGNAGIVFRNANNDYGVDNYRGYYAGFSGSQLIVGKADNSFGGTPTWTQLAAVPITATANGFYHLRVVAHSARIRVYFNYEATPSVDLSDTANSFGGVGLRTFNTAASFAGVSVFRNTDLSTYTLSNNISSSQGQSAWRYQQTTDGINFTDMTWVPSRNAWFGACAYNAIWAPSQIHPDCNDSVVTWVAPKAGPIRITGNPRKQAAGGDGVQVKVLQNASQIWPASGWQFIAGTDTTGVNHNLTTNVAAGDTIRFVVNRNVTITSDETNWNPTIQFADPDTFTLSANFSATQGWANWRYQQTADGVTYSDLTWQPSANQWLGACTYNLIWAPSQIHPDCNDTVVTWVAPKAGPVRVTGNPRKQASGGDGVQVKVLQNASQLWPASGWQFIAGTDTTGVNHNLTTNVAAGDTIRFVVNRNVTITSDETNWNPTIQYADPNTFTLSANFSATTQGWNGWRYQQTADGITFTDMTAQPSGTWQGACAYNLIWAPSQIHPDCNDTVVTWVAPRSGPVRITGNPRKQASGGDGVQVKVLQNASQLWPASGWQFIAGTDTTGVTHNLTTNVAMGDTIRFVVNRNVTITSDETNWNPTIQYADPNTFTLSTSFSSVQGWNGWRYQQTADGVNFTDMTWIPPWKGACTYNAIWAPAEIHPDCNDSVVTWVAPRPGTVSITGNPRKVYAAGDGVNVKILRNGTQLWPASGWQYIAGTDTIGVNHSFSVTVAAGDSIRFVVNRNVTATTDETSWNPTIQYTG
jgi:hypothetical protein